MSHVTNRMVLSSDASRAGLLDLKSDESRSFSQI